MANKEVYTKIYKNETAYTNSFNFDGSNDYISIPNLGYTGDYSHTFEAWVNIDTVTGNGTTLFAIGPATIDQGIFWAYTSTTNLRFAIWAREDVNLTVTDPTGLGWFHIACIYDALLSTVFVYYNGVLEATSSVTNNPNLADSNYNVGRVNNGDAAAFYDGKMSEIKLWSDGRTRQEIAFYQNRTLLDSTLQRIQEIPDDNLQVYYPMNQDSGLAVTDYSGNGYDGTLTGASASDWVTDVPTGLLRRAYKGFSTEYDFNSIRSYLNAGYGDLSLSIPAKFGQESNIGVDGYEVEISYHPTPGSQKLIYSGEIVVDEQTASAKDKVSIRAISGIGKLANTYFESETGSYNITYTNTRISDIIDDILASYNSQQPYPKISYTRLKTNFIDFDGSGDYVNIADTADLESSDSNFTVSAWVNADVNNRTAASKWGTTTGDQNWKIELNSSTRFVFTVRTSTAEYTATDTITRNLGQWYNVAGVFDATNSKIILYVDGEAVAETSTVGNMSWGAANVRVSGLADSSSLWDGQISEFEIWNEARSRNQILLLMSRSLIDESNTLITSEADLDNLAGYWPLNEESGITATDYSVNSNNGVITIADRVLDYKVAYRINENAVPNTYISIDFNTTSHLDALQAVIKETRYNWVWYLDTDSSIQLRQIPLEPQFYLFMGRDIEYVTRKLDKSKIRNEILMWDGADTSPVARRYRDWGSINMYGRYTKIVRDGRLTASGMDNYATKEILNYHEPINSVEVKIFDQTAGGKYDISDIKIGSLIRIVNLENSDIPTTLLVTDKNDTLDQAILYSYDVSDYQSRILAEEKNKQRQINWQDGPSSYTDVTVDTDFLDTEV